MAKRAVSDLSENPDDQLLNFPAPQPDTRVTNPDAVLGGNKTGHRAKKSRAWLITLVIILSLVLVVLVIAAFGGFKDRTTNTTEIALGAEMNLGPISISQEKALATTNDLALPETKRVWTIRVSGQCAMNATDDSTVNFSSIISSPNITYAGGYVGDQLFVSENKATKLTIGQQTDGSTNTRSTISPGLDPMPCTISYQMPPGYQPADHITVIAHQLEYDVPGNINVEQAGKRWLASNNALRVKVPLTKIS